MRSYVYSAGKADSDRETFGTPTQKQRKEEKRKRKRRKKRETSIQNRLLLEPPMPLLFLSRFPLYLDDLKAP